MNHNLKRSSLFISVLIALGLLLLVAFSFLAGYWFNDHSFLFSKSQYPLFDQAYRLLEQYGLSPLPEQSKIEYGLIRGLLQAYNDPHTVLVEPPQHELQSNQLQGRFGGIGARVEQDADSRYRLFPFPDSPARDAGIRDGDILVRVDKIEILSNTPRDIVLAALRGESGSSVEIVIIRPPDNEETTFKVRRKEIALPSVTWNLTADNPTFGIVQINIIAASTAEEISNAIRDLSSQGAQFFILDLRNNSGGLVDAGVNIARLFLHKGDAILEQQYRGRVAQTLSAERDGDFTGLPLVVWINNGTASAAEIVAGALKARQRTITIGTPSFGKDSIQLVFDLQDGSSLHVTSARWSIPGLEPPVKDHGILPDIWIDNDPPDTINQRYLQATFGAFSGQGQSAP